MKSFITIGTTCIVLSADSIFYSELGLFPASLHFLQRLDEKAREEGFTVVFLDRKPHDILVNELQRFNIKHYFDRVQGSTNDEVNDKPQPTAFENATYGLNTREVVMIGTAEDKEFAAECGAIFVEVTDADDGSGVEALLNAISSLD